MKLIQVLLVFLNSWMEFRVLEFSPRLKYALSTVGPFESKPAKRMSKSLSKPDGLFWLNLYASSFKGSNV